MLAPLALLAAAAPPVPPAPAPAPARAHWAVDWGEPRCLLMREGGEGEPNLAVRFVPADRKSEVWIIDSRWSSHAFGATGRIRLHLEPAGGEPIRNFVFLRVGQTGRYALAVENAGEEFLDRLAGAEAISVRRNDEEVARIPTPGAAKAVAAARACEDDMLARWGVDPAVFRSLARRPKAIGFFLDPSDYPETALRSGTTGYSVARVDIAADGKVTGCAIVLPSGSADLDRATCTGALRRGRYTPAIGADGKPVRALTIFSVRWELFG
jgi:TonB family protein